MSNEGVTALNGTPPGTAGMPLPPPLLLLLRNDARSPSSITSVRTRRPRPAPGTGRAACNPRLSGKRVIGMICFFSARRRICGVVARGARRIGVMSRRRRYEVAGAAATTFTYIIRL